MTTATSTAQTADITTAKDSATSPEYRRDVGTKWNGWGYVDSYLYFNDNLDMFFTDDGRYIISGNKLHRMKHMTTDVMGIDMKFRSPSQPIEAHLESMADPIRNEPFINSMQQQQMELSFDSRLRLNRAHGQSIDEIFDLRHSTIKRTPDMIIWPKNHNEVVIIVAAANEHNVVIIPIGGGTNVTDALKCPPHETRMIVSLDLSKMNRLLWIDETNLTARAEAGIVGIDLEELLNKQGFTIGHQPDSVEFSTLGGWVATRASGMKKSKYGNIEDLIVHITTVTPKGVLAKSCQVPRISAGPDMHHFIMGSEGTLGVVTEVTFKICPVPQCVRYGSVVFPTFKHGVACIREAVKQKCFPASVRLVDNVQFKAAKAFKLDPLTPWYRLIDHIQHLYITKWKGFDAEEVVAMVQMFEGTEEEVNRQENLYLKIAKEYGGFSGGKVNGRYGYLVIFSIAYMRDIGLDYGCIGDSMETSVPWDKVLIVCENVKEVFRRETAKYGAHHVFSSRLTQAYDTGVCLYFYYVLNYSNMSPGINPMSAFASVMAAGKDEVYACGGSVSHHHGIGKQRSKWLPLNIGEVGLGAIQSVKQHLDPNNIFANGNLYPCTAKL